MPSITGSWYSLQQSTFEETRPTGGYLHFTEQAPWQVSAAVRQRIANLAATYGWPLRGIFISGSGEVPHFAAHLSEFPPQGGALAIRPERLQTALDARLSDVYEDIDLGRGENTTFLRLKTHIWPNPARSYSNAADMLLLVPRAAGVGDYALSSILERGDPVATWWLEEQF